MSEALTAEEIAAIHARITDNLETIRQNEDEAHATILALQARLAAAEAVVEAANDAAHLVPMSIPKLKRALRDHYALKAGHGENADAVTGAGPS